MPFLRRLTLLRYCLVALCLSLTATGALCFKFLQGRGETPGPGRSKPLQVPRSRVICD